VQVQARLAGSDRFGAQLQAVQHQARRGLQQKLVLAAGGLAFCAVGHHHLRAPRGGHDGQLAVRREGRSAPAGQPGPFDVRD
jgi:hypothetical protein